MYFSCILGIRGSGHSVNLEGGGLGYIFFPLYSKRQAFPHVKGTKKIEEDKTKPVPCAAKIPLRGPSGLRKTLWMINSLMLFIDFLLVFSYLSFPVDISLIDSWLQITPVTNCYLSNNGARLLWLRKMHEAFDSFRRFKLNKLWGT